MGAIGVGPRTDPEMHSHEKLQREFLETPEGLAFARRQSKLKMMNERAGLGETMLTDAYTGKPHAFSTQSEAAIMKGYSEWKASQDSPPPAADTTSAYIKVLSKQNTDRLLRGGKPRSTLL